MALDPKDLPSYPEAYGGKEISQALANVEVATAIGALSSGAATSANQTTANTSLASIDGKIPASLGAKAASASLAELTKCQRYAQLITNGCQSPVAGNLLYFFPFRVPMFLAPVQTTISNGTAVNASTYGLGAQNAYTHSFGISAATAAGSILGHISLYSAHIP